MKTKWFVFIAIVATVTISGIIFQQATAQLRDRSERRLGGADAREGQLMETALDAFVNNAWTDLSFVLKVDDETLIKARPIHQAAYDEIQEKRQKARESDDSRAALQELAGMRETAKKSIETAETEFDTKLATVLTEEQLTKLKELRKDRREELQERRDDDDTDFDSIVRAMDAPEIENILINMAPGLKTGQLEKFARAVKGYTDRDDIEGAKEYIINQIGIGLGEERKKQIEGRRLLSADLDAMVDMMAEAQAKGWKPGFWKKSPEATQFDIAMKTAMANFRYHMTDTQFGPKEAEFFEGLFSDLGKNTEKNLAVIKQFKEGLHRHQHITFMEVIGDADLVRWLHVPETQETAAGEMQGTDTIQNIQWNATHIQVWRDNDVSDEEIRIFLERRGLAPEEIDALLKTSEAKENEETE